jgi:hypothetical protein
MAWPAWPSAEVARIIEIGCPTVNVLERDLLSEPAVEAARSGVSLPYGVPATSGRARS